MVSARAAVGIARHDPLAHSYAMPFFREENLPNCSVQREKAGRGRLCNITHGLCASLAREKTVRDVLIAWSKVLWLVCLVLIPQARAPSHRLRKETPYVHNG
jgi:hypothetical protein